MAVVSDPQGAVMTLIQSRGADPGDGDWLWNEVWSSDPDAARASYQRLVPEYQEASAQNGAYRFLASAGKPRLGVLPHPVTGMKVGIAGPSVDLGPVKIHTGVNLGRFL